MNPLEFHPFVQGDWFGFGGATPFADGSDPVVAVICVDGVEGLVIVDGQGVFVTTAQKLDAATAPEGATVERTWWLKHGSSLTTRATLLLRAETTSVRLLALGFDPVRQEG
ncbi:MAG: hypothetical protein HOW73_00860 [Polyangiaceae bacterium]|nr:hypothetical protein [Polyangiaceae bacterium]